MSIEHRHLHEHLPPGNLQTTSSINSNASSTSSSSALSTNSSNLSNGSSGNNNNVPPSPPLSNLEHDNLPPNVRFELDQLELELIEGDITQKGYDKKRAKLLANYLTTIDEISSSEKSATKSENSFNLNCKLFKNKQYFVH